MPLSDSSAPPEAAPTDLRVDVNIPRFNQAAVALFVAARLPVAVVATGADHAPPCWR